MNLKNFHNFFTFSIIGCLTMPGILFGPAIVGILVDHADFNEQYAGWAMAYQSIGSATALLIISSFIHRLDLKKLAFITLIFAFILEIYCSFNSSPVFSFLIIRLLIGAFTTIANIAVYTSIASLKNYERGFGMFVLMQYLVSGLGLYFMILYSDYIGSQGLFLLLGLFNLIALFMIRTLPNQQANNNTESALTSETKVLFSGIALLAIIGFGIHEMSGVAQFTYIERIGVSILIDNQSLSNIMLISSLLGIPGAIICITLGKKYGLVIPILFGVSICLLGMSLFLFSKTYLTYIIRMCLMGFGWSIVLPYIQSHLANIDKKGSALAAGNSFATIGGALGALLAAKLIGENSNYDALLQVSMLIYIIAASFLIISIKLKKTHESTTAQRS